MAESQFNTPDAIGPIRDRDVYRVCGLSGLVAAKQKVVSLQKLRDGLEISIRDLERQRNREQMLNKGLMVLRFTKATSDAFISIAADLAKVVFGKAVGDEAEAVDAIYGAATPLAEEASSSIAGQKVDWVKAVGDSAKKGVNRVTNNDGYRILTQTTVVKVEVIRAAMNEDKEGLMKSAGSYLIDLHVAIAESTKKVGAERVAAFVKISKDAFEYNEKVGNAFDELLDGDRETAERYLSLKTSLVHQARRLSRTIAELQSYIADCGAELDRNSVLVRRP